MKFGFDVEYFPQRLFFPDELFPQRSIPNNVIIFSVLTFPLPKCNHTSHTDPSDAIILALHCIQHEFLWKCNLQKAWLNSVKHCRFLHSIAFKTESPNYNVLHILLSYSDRLL